MFVCSLVSFLSKLLLSLNIYGRRNFSSKSACPDNNRRAWVDITLEEMKAFLGLVVHTSLTCKGDVKEYWSLNPSQAFPFFRQVFTRDRFLDILHSLHYPALEGSVHKLKRFYILCNTLGNNTKGFICLREIFMWMRALLDSKAERRPPNICQTNITIIGV